MARTKQMARNAVYKTSCVPMLERYNNYKYGKVLKHCSNKNISWLELDTDNEGGLYVKAVHENKLKDVFVIDYQKEKITLRTQEDDGGAFFEIQRPIQQVLNINLS